MYGCLQFMSDIYTCMPHSLTFLSVYLSLFLRTIKESQTTCNLKYCCSLLGMQRLNLTGRRNPPPPIIPVEPFHKSEPKVEELPRPDAPTLCSDNSEQPVPVLHSQSSSSPHRTINPIYIAVPLAGVCVLLALIIFAMYLLKRRNTYYDHYPYHTHVSTLHPHCHVDPKRTVPKMNRCTDSERSSSGSESKLFIQA